MSDWWSPRTSPPLFLLWWWSEFRTLKESRIRAAPFFTFDGTSQRTGTGELRGRGGVSSTCGFVVGLLPVENDEGGAALHGNHGEVGRRDARRAGHVQVVGFFVREVTQGGGNRARFLWPFIGLVDDMWSCGRP